ncbi:transport protein Avl9-domain-containing protein [Chaetomium sp. MPI-CAGE-AT-0009]|nr:transport protein Avl9-domain-containing protein [Chaetomium sp. MPI-CAGE-AT-0009]
MSVPPTPTTDKGGREAFIPLVSVVDFHHARGPEVERWFGVEEGRDPAAEYDWTLLPFMALSDGAHALTEDFSYFTLLRPATDSAPATSLFGISCTRQMDASQLLNRPAEVTRSTVQKAVVVIADSPQHFGMLRERLSVVTKAWFVQREFTDVEILRRFQESLADEKARGLLHEDEDRDQYLGLSLRELVREFRWQTLVLLKCCLLQPKMLFFGTRCERLCLTQFSLISLIPRLLHNLQDSAGPELDNYEKSLSTPTSLRTSDRNSLLSYMGLPLQIFGKGSLFGPYTPLQQLDILADFGTKSYIVGSTNSLLLQQKDRYSDILINLDEDTINVTSPSLKAALQLSTPDRRWIDFITQNVNDTWDDANPSRPKTMGYVGSEEFIRVQFEEYLLSLISSVKYRAHLARHAHNPRMLLPDIDGDPSVDFAPDFVDAWARTENFRLWNSHTDSHLFDVVEPKHPCAGGLTIDDIQRRITQQVHDLHWDERFAQGREVLGRNLAAGREKASTLFGKLYSDMEALREAQRRRNEEARQQQHQNQNQPSQTGATGNGEKNGTAAAAPADPPKAQPTMQAVGSKAGAFVNSWAAWAGEKRRAAWGGGGSARSTTDTATATTTTTSTSTATPSPRNSLSGWGAAWGRGSSSTTSGSNATRSRGGGGGGGGGGYDALPSAGGGGAGVRSSVVSAAVRTDDGADSESESESVLSGSGSGHRAAGRGLLDRRRGSVVGSVSGESVVTVGDGTGGGGRGGVGGAGSESVLSSPGRGGRRSVEGILNTVPSPAAVGGGAKTNGFNAAGSIPASAPARAPTTSPIPAPPPAPIPAPTPLPTQPAAAGSDGPTPTNLALRPKKQPDDEDTDDDDDTDNEQQQQARPAIIARKPAPLRQPEPESESESDPEPSPPLLPPTGPAGAEAGAVRGGLGR